MGITIEKEYVVLISIVDIGGAGTKKQVLDNINDKQYIKFSEEDLKMKDNRSEIKWRNDLAFTRKHLQVNKYIDGAEKNNWKITDSGIEYLFQLTEKFIKTNSSISKISEVAIIRALDYYEEYIAIGVGKSKEETTVTVQETEYERFVKMRIGQSIFKNKLLKKETCCKICGMDDKGLLVASHIKPWSKSDNQERLDENNGFLLCPNHDALFDRGYITFDDLGNMVISSILDKSNYAKLDIGEEIKIKILEENREYLKWHRETIYK